MKLSRKFAALAVCAGLAGVPAAGIAAPMTGAETVQTLYNTLLTTMRNGQSLGQQGRYGQIAPVVGELFDVQFMTRLVAGPAWAAASEPQRQQLVQAFSRYISSVYAERFDSYSGERLQITGQQQTAAGLIVQSQIVKSDGEPVNINYLVRQTPSGWQIADIYLNGTISELATQRSDFAETLSHYGVNGLIGALYQKSAMLGTPRSS